ncbi:Pol polyprotein [Plecturocebus cupreus]
MDPTPDGESSTTAAGAQLYKPHMRPPFRCPGVGDISICWSQCAHTLDGTERAHEVTHVLLRDLIPRFGLPLRIGSDNRPAFVEDLVQKTATALGITWKLHAAYRSQSSGEVEKMNWTVKNSLGKVCQENKIRLGAGTSLGVIQN